MDMVEDWPAHFNAACDRLELEPDAPDWLKQFLYQARLAAAELAPNPVQEAPPAEFVYPH